MTKASKQEAPRNGRMPVLFVGHGSPMNIIEDNRWNRGFAALRDLVPRPDSDDGRLAHPTADHWLPLIYAQAATDDQDRVHFPTEGFDWGSISMRNIVFG